jgi:hypothetical protein
LLRALRLLLWPGLLGRLRLLRLRPLLLSLLGALLRLLSGLRALLRWRPLLRGLLGPLLRLRLLLLWLWALRLLRLRPLLLSLLRLRLFLLWLWALRLLRLRPLLRGLLGPLLRLLRGLRALLRLRLLLLCLWALRLCLWALLLRGWRRSVLFGFGLLAALRVRRGQCPEKQKQRAGGGGSNELHGNHLRVRSLIGYARGRPVRLNRSNILSHGSGFLSLGFVSGVFRRLLGRRFADSDDRRIPCHFAFLLLELSYLYLCTSRAKRRNRRIAF